MFTLSLTCERWREVQGRAVEGNVAQAFAPSHEVPGWVSRRVEHVSFRDDRSVVRRITTEFYVPGPIFRGDDGQVYSPIPLSVIRVRAR